MALLLVVVFGACSVPQGEGPRPGSCDPFQLTMSVPAHDAVGVPSDVVPAVTFNDFPDPDTVDVSTILVYTGFYYHTGRYWVDLVHRRALFRPTGNLTFGLGYTLVVKTAIRSLRGCLLERPAADPDGTRSDAHVIRFQIAEPPSPPTDPQPPKPTPPSATYTQVTDLFAAHCAGSVCHLAPDARADDPQSCLADPGGRLSLCRRDARDALVGIPSRQVARLVRVAPRDSARSYLLRKLIGAPPIVGHAGVPGASSTRPELSRDEQAVIQTWIDTGAL